MGRSWRMAQYLSRTYTVFVRYHKERAYAVAHFVEALRKKLGGRGFDSRWCHWNFSLALTFRPHYGPGVVSAANRIFPGE